MISYKQKQASKEAGYILLMSLILLILLTVLALSGVTMNITQTRVATNATDTEVSFEKTEAALNEALNLIVNGSYSASNFVSNNNGFYIYSESLAPLWTTIDWTNASNVISSFQGKSGPQATYIIEELPSVVKPGQNMKTPTHVYRVTARSLNQSGNSSIILQSTIEIQQ